MERIELFDSYINNQLSDAQRSEFETRLKSDDDFAAEFKIYLFTVDGICREAEQDNLDFGTALKNISILQLREIIGKKNVDTKSAYKPLTDEGLPVVRADRSIDIGLQATGFWSNGDEWDNPTIEPQREAIDENEQSHQAPKQKTFRIKAWMWQVASIAAVVIIAFTVVFNIERNAKYSVDNAIFSCSDINPLITRDEGESIDIATLSDEDLKAKLPELVSLYQKATSDEIADYGFTLAMAYLRLHDRNQAKDILDQLVSKFENNPEYNDYVSKWKSILKLLE